MSIVIKKVFANPIQVNLINQIKWVLIDNTLMIGNFMDHADMVMETLHPGLFVQDTKGFMQKQTECGRRISAAGIADRDGNMVGWKSTSFVVTTPDYLRAELSELVKKTILEDTGWPKPASAN